MANSKSAKKSNRQNKKRCVVNSARRSAVKTAVKKVAVAVETSVEQESLRTLLKDAQVQIARAKGKGLLHPNTAARKLSRIAKRVAQSTRAA